MPKTGARKTRAKSPASNQRKATEAEPDERDERGRRRDLLAAAYALTAERGLEGLRTRDIAARAGVNISTLHYYFGTKESLLVALVEYASEKFAGPHTAPAGRRGGPRTSLREHFEGSWRTFQDNPQLGTVLQELVLRGQRDSSTRSAFRELHDGWNKEVERILRQGVADGSIRSDLDPRVGARIVTSFIMGAMGQLAVDPRAFDFLDAAERLLRTLASAD
jgi:AcrR family transcriptional regulator